MANCTLRNAIDRISCVRCFGNVSRFVSSRTPSEGRAAFVGLYHGSPDGSMLRNLAFFSVSWLWSVLGLVFNFNTYISFPPFKEPDQDWDPMLKVTLQNFLRRFLPFVGIELNRSAGMQSMLRQELEAIRQKVEQLTPLNPALKG